MKRTLLSILLAISLLGNAQNIKNENVLRFSMKTRWADKIDPDHVWDVYPRPQMVRNNWINLNGEWEYAIKPITETAIPKTFDGKIIVPFAAESMLSGVKKMVGKENYLWYKTSFKTPDIQEDDLLHLNFDAVDWEATIYINGKEAGVHKGGFTNFSIDITSYLQTDDLNELVVKVWDPTDAGTQPRGKQTATPEGIWYTPVTGIWQTVWLEKTSATYIKALKTTPDIDHDKVTLQLFMNQRNPDLIAEVEVKASGKTIKSIQENLSEISKISQVEISVPNARLWSPQDPFLYDISIIIKEHDGTVVDKIQTYFGMRKIGLGKDNIGNTVIKLNNKDIFQFGLLDQGWWPDGLFTAPTPEAMLWDVDQTMALGFNTIRKHVKVEPATFYYECDKKGVLVWQDMPNGNYLNDLRVEAWEQDVERPVASSLQFEYELREMIDQLYNFPSIVVWVPFNEGWGQYDTERVANWLSYYDPSRINDAPSGWADRGVGDLVDVHIYPGPGMEAPDTQRAAVIGEFGGLGLTVEDHLWWNKKNWGYLTYKDPGAFEKRFIQLIEDLYALRNFGLSAAIYTQTTDVEGEVNGLITYDREITKLDIKKTKKLIEPLYKSPSNTITLLEDSEHHPQEWLSYTGTKKIKKLLKNKKSDNSLWTTAQGPFSSYDNYFLPDGTTWDPSKRLILKKSFTVDQVPSKVYFKYYQTKTTMKIYINGKLVINEEHKGGRKRHYRLMSLLNSEIGLKKGTNDIMIELQPDSNSTECAFDMGIYTSGNMILKQDDSKK